MLVPSLRRPAAIAGLLLGTACATSSAAAAAAAAASATGTPKIMSAKRQAKAEFMRAMESSPAARKLRADSRAKSNLRRKIAAAAVHVPAASVPVYTTTTTRRLEENNNGDDEGDEDVWDAFGFDPADYSLKYAGCSAVATYSDELAENEELATVVQSRKFVVFRLCPTDYCSDDRTYGCSSNYGEYILDMEEYLLFMKEYKEEQMERFCEYCEECMNMEEEWNEEQQQEEEEEEQNQEEEEEENQEEVSIGALLSLDIISIIGLVHIHISPCNLHFSFHPFLSNILRERMRMKKVVV